MIASLNISDHQWQAQYTLASVNQQALFFSKKIVNFAKTTSKKQSFTIAYETKE